MKTKLDETNLAIIKALRNGRASFRDIAADLGLSEVTVRTRAARLIEDGVLDICGQVDVEKLPDTRWRWWRSSCVPGSCGRGRSVLPLAGRGFRGCPDGAAQTLS